MQKCNFSETQFLFQYIFEHYNKYPYSPFPFFPDTVAEGRYYGFDVCMGSLFYQFKICNLFEATDVKGPVTADIWSAFSNPSYVQKIKFSGNQFGFLKKIAAIKKYSHSVFYVMPEFHTRPAIKANYISKKIINASAHFNINDFPNGLTGDHSLVFTDSSNHGVLFSEPVNIEKSVNVQNIERFINNVNMSLFDAAKEIRGLIDGDNFSEEFPENISFEAGFVKATQSILLNEYNIHWFPIIDFNKANKQARI